MLTALLRWNYGKQGLGPSEWASQRGSAQFSGDLR